MTLLIRSVMLLAGCILALAVQAQVQSQVLANVGPIAVDFGAVKMGATVTVPVTIQNLSAGALGIASTGISGTNAYTIDSSTCGSLDYQVNVGSSCQFLFHFTPTDASGTPFTTTSALLIQAGAVNQVVLLHFSGSGNETLTQVSPVSIDFGSTFIGQQVTLPVTVTNTHTAPVTFTGGAPSGSAGFSGGTSCGSLAPGATCTFDYSFTPSGNGQVQSDTSIGVAASSPASMYQNVAIHLAGNGVSTLPSPNVAVWPVGIDFGLIKVGHAAKVPQYYRNNGTNSISIAGGGFNDDQGGAFAGFTEGGPNCDTQLQAPGVTCANSYQFQPRQVQAYTAATGQDFSDSNGTYYVSLAFAGTGVGTLARVSPPTVDLGSVAFGTSISVPVVITNTSDDPLANFTGGQMNYPFATSNTCGASLAVGASCAYTYTFTAPAAHDRIQARYSATTLLSFNNATGIQPIVRIQISAEVGDRIFGDDFGG